MTANLSVNCTFTASADALIEYNSVMPVQVSPFMAMHTENSLMHSAQIDFEHLMGGIVTRDRLERDCFTLRIIKDKTGSYSEADVNSKDLFRD